MFYEQASRYFGDSIYEYSLPDQPDNGWNTGRSGIIRENGITRNRMDHAMVKSAEFWLTRCLPAWRAYDISGIWLFERTVDYFSDAVAEQKDLPPSQDITTPGLKPDYSMERIYDYPNDLHAAVCMGQKPFLAFLAGRPERFTSREHAYYSGDTVSKQMIFSNDFLKPVNVQAEWTICAKDDSKVAAKGQWNGSIEPGGNRRIPFTWKTPDVAERKTFQIRLTATAGKEICRDSFDLHIFPKNKLQFSKKPVLLYDETGKTKDLLKQMDIPFKDNFSNADLDQNSLLVIGRGAFTSAFLKKAQEINLEQRLKNGLNMLILAQDREGALKMYLEERRSRQVFTKDRNHPILKGISDADLQYWRGEPDSLVPYPDLKQSANNKRFMRWGTEGTVSSFVLDKPFSGRFRILLDCDADLSRTVLMEYFAEKGRILFCQLDFQPRYGKDPAATILADRVLSYAQNPEQMPHPINVLHSGSKEPFKDLNFDFEKNIPLAKADLLILGRDFKMQPEKIKSFVDQGGIVFATGLSDADYKTLGIPLPTKQNVRLAGYPVGNPLLRGVGNSDFYFNPSLMLPVYGKSKIFHRIPFGKGYFLVCTPVPADFKNESSRIKMKRIISVILTNLGVPAETSFCFSSENEDISLDGKKVPFHIDPASQGEERGWMNADFNDSSWKKIKLGYFWESQGITVKNPNFKPGAGLPYDGDAWYRIPVEIPDKWKTRELYFEAAAIDDIDWVWFNGHLIGHTDEKTPNYWLAKRLYRIPSQVIHFGEKNVIAVKVRDLRGNGGIIGKVRIGGEKPFSSEILYPRSSRLIFNFDPNSWRQW